MASVSKDGKGWRIRYVDQHGDARTLRPGKCNKATAFQISQHIAQLVNAQVSGEPVAPNTAAWISKLGDQLRRKMSRAGLVAERASSRVDEFVNDFVSRGVAFGGKGRKRRKAAAGTVEKWRASAKHLVDFFKSRPLRSITPEDAEQFREYLGQKRIKKTGEPWQENSIRSVIANAKMFFNAAMSKGLVDANPFEDEAATTLENRKRDFFVTPLITLKVLDACPDVQWRLLVALYRLAGLRKSEVFHLLWSEVLWDSDRMLVHAPKTAQYEGREERYVPIASIRPHLEAAFEDAEPGTDRIITRYSPTNSNLDKPLKQILKKAGIVPWPKLFQNMRATCETEWLDAGIPAHVVANWIGHSVTVQNKHYAQVDDHHFEQFTNAVAIGGHSGGHEQSGTGRSQPRTRPDNKREKANENPFRSPLFSFSLNDKVTPQGLEPQLTEPESVVLPITPRGNVVTSVFEVRQSISAFKRCKE